MRDWKWELPVIMFFLLLAYFVVWVGLQTFAQHDVGVYTKIGSVDHVTVYKVMMERRFGEDRLLFASSDVDRAMWFRGEVTQ